MRLSTNFTLAELVRTNHKSLDNTPTPIVIDRLQDLCVNFLEPIRARFGPLRVNSGYRSPTVNAAVGGAPTSAHQFGCAADIDPLTPNIKLQELVNWVIDNNLDFDQMILESSGTADWLHIGILRPGYELVPRHQLLRFKNGTYTRYDRTINYGI